MDPEVETWLLDLIRRCRKTGTIEDDVMFLVRSQAALSDEPFGDPVWVRWLCRAAVAVGINDIAVVLASDGMALEEARLAEVALADAG